MLPAEVRSLCTKVFQGKPNPDGFADLMQALFACTVFAEGQYLSSFHSTTNIIGARAGRVLKLNNGDFLKFYMRYETETQHQPLTITTASFQFQIDEEGMSDEFVFRYDYSIKPEENHPQAHLQINGVLKHPEVSHSPLPDIRFPVNRPSVESMLKFLITDFGLKANDERNWEENLSISENAFLDYQAAKRL